MLMKHMLKNCKHMAYFDKEQQDQQNMERKNFTSASHAKAHTMSDSEDSEPAGKQEDGYDGSEDLFDEEWEKIDDKGKAAKDQLSDNCSSDEVTDFYDADTDVDNKSESEEEKTKPECKYGEKCYRKNPSHIKDFSHTRKKKSEEEKDCIKEAVPAKLQKMNSTLKDTRTPLQVYEEIQPFSFFLTKVKDIPHHHNMTGAMNLKDILSRDMGTLKSSCHFNFMFDISWLVKQYPEESRKCPILLVHGEQARAEMAIKAEAASFPNISLCKANLEIAYGTHHTKMMFLLYKNGLRVVIHTANLIPNDWHQKTQGIWISPVFPPLVDDSDKGESTTFFKRDLLQYLEAYKSAKLAEWERCIKAHNLSSATVHLIASVPGRHMMSNKNAWGHLKLKKVLMERGPDQSLVKNWPVVGQFSSIGSLGPNPDAWLLSEWGQSMSQCKKVMSSGLTQSKLHLIFPSKDNIRLSLEGYNGGGCVPYSIKTASKQPWLVPFFCQWKSEGRGRSKAVPHIKTYSKCSPDGSQAAWFIVTSANLSKAAWGTLEKKGSQLMIRSYELGVLFLPQDYGCKNAFNVSSDMNDILDHDRKVFPLPYDLPASTYIKGDRPWFIDVPCMDAPDTFGTVWCPPL